MHSKPAEGMFVWECDFGIERKIMKREKMKFLAMNARILES